MAIGLIGAAALAALVACLCLGTLLAMIHTGRFRDVLLRYAENRTHRTIRVEGSFEAHLSWRGSWLTARNVSIGNPPWTAPGTTAHIGALTVRFAPWRPLARVALAELRLEGAILTLSRDAMGHANWQMIDPERGGGSGPPLIRNLYVPQAQLSLDDARRHLKFAGSATAGDLGGGNAPQLRISGAGNLNGRPARIEFTGDSLRLASLGAPYGFSFIETSGGTSVQGQGLIARAFDFSVLDLSFAANGPDLRDLYFLYGISLPDTGAFRLTGKFTRRDDLTQFHELEAESGESDMSGSVATRTVNGRSSISAQLHSRRLRLGDVGGRALHRDDGSQPGSTSGSTSGAEPVSVEKAPGLFSDKPLQLDTMRRNDSEFRFDAARVDVGKLSLHSVNLLLKIDHGQIELSSLDAQLLQGRLSAQAGIDASKDMPVAKLEVRLSDAQLKDFPFQRGGDPPLDGAFDAQLKLTGVGRSMREFAAGADGSMSAAIPQGTMRATLAELTGVDLRGLGLELARSHRDSAIRCGVAKLQAHAGILSVRTLVLDTDPVLITGTGLVRLDSGALQLDIQGRPKSTRFLRLRAPLLVRGTVTSPVIDLRPTHKDLVLVDPGTGKDADCRTLLARMSSDLQ